MQQTDKPIEPPPPVLQYGKADVAQKRIGEISVMLGIVAGLLAIVMWIYGLPFLVTVVRNYHVGRDNDLDELIPWLAIASVLTFISIRWCRKGFRR